MQGNSSADKSTFEDIVNDITQDIASKNDPTGAYDQTRLVSDIEFDCELKVGNDTIDLTITYDEDGNIQKVEIQDESVAAKHGISDSVIMDYLF
jgi:C-terminal processing protease CtpA/Prc